MYKMEHTREAYGKILAQLGEIHKEIVVMDADLSSSTKTIFFGKKFPERFIDMGISEADLMGTAAGLAAAGKTVFVSTFAMFGSARPLEQIRNTIAYGNFNVKIVVTHSGLAVGEDGASHQALEDIAYIRPIPNITVLVPADAEQTRTAIKKLVDHKGPVYVRLGRPKVPIITDGQFEIGRSYILKEGTDITLAAMGSMVVLALESAEKLQEKGISAEVINCSSIKPFDKDTLLKSVRKTKKIVSIEDHSVTGGLGSAIAEILIQDNPVPMKFIGIENRFGESGNPDKLYAKYGLTVENIISKVKSLI